MADQYQTIAYNNKGTQIGSFPTLEWFNKIKARVDFQDKIVVDLGCAEGMFCVLARQAGARMVTGIDSSEARIKTAKQLNSQWGYMNEIIWKNVEDYKYPKMYDITIASMILHWLKNPQIELKRIKAKTKEKFVIIHRTHNPAYQVPENGLWFPTNEALDIEMDGWHNIHKELLLVQDNQKEVWLNIYEKI